jgi:RNA polymerase sigma factor (sigma-70 family)
MRGTAYQKWSLTQEAFDGLLAGLGPDIDSAAGKYVELRRNLVRLFEWRGCPTPDEYTDETFNRCARKISEGEPIRDIATYCIGIARMLVREMGRERLKAPRSLEDAPEPRTLPAPIEDDRDERLNCLRRCLDNLPPVDRDLILRYYQGDASQKISNRKELSQLFGLPPSTLRMRALRIREKLQSALEKCLYPKNPRTLILGPGHQR